jgi:glycosyltransferase involved in cell wall biosynthesis
LAASGDFRVKVFYTWGQAKGKVIDKGFGIEREWDIDLLSGYDHAFVQNISSGPGSHHYKGIINPSLISEVKAFNPDKIIVYGWKFKSHLQLMRHFKGKTPLYFRGDSTLLDDAAGFSIKKSLRCLLLQWVYGHVDFALSPGTASDAYFLNAGLTANQIIRAPHAIDNERFAGIQSPKNGDERFDATQSPGNHDERFDATQSTGNDTESLLKIKAQEWRKELSIAEDAKLFLFAGKLEPKKNPELLIRAFLKLHQQYPNLHLVIVGNGILEQTLQQSSSTTQPLAAMFNSSTISTYSTPNQEPTTHNPQPQTPNPQLTTPNPQLTTHNPQPQSQNPEPTTPITFLPFQNQSMMPLVYRLGDVFVLPSKGPAETWGLAINEAMACGRPVIASDKCGAAADMIKVNENGFVFKAGDENDLYNCMEKMVNADLKSMGARAQETVQHFSYASFASTLRSLT